MNFDIKSSQPLTNAPLNASQPPAPPLPSISLTNAPSSKNDNNKKNTSLLENPTKENNQTSSNDKHRNIEDDIQSVD